MDANGVAATVDKLVERLSGPIEITYPLRDDETVAEWQERSIAALGHLQAKGLLARSDSLGKSLLGSLLALVDEPMLPSFEEVPGRSILLGELVRTIAEPGRITQGMKGTCAATCVETYVAERDPAEYARLVVGLVAPEGKVMLRTGEPLCRDEEALVPTPQEYRRGPVSRLFQVACMEYAYPDLDYRNAEDGQFDGETNTGTGLSLAAFDHVLKGITGDTWNTLSDGYSKMAELFAKLGLDTSGVPQLHRDAITIIERTTEAGDTLFATLEMAHVGSPLRRAAAAVTMEHAAHKIRVLKVDRKAGIVEYEDPMDPERPWLTDAHTQIADSFGRCCMPIEEFETLLVELSYQPKFWNGAGAQAASGSGPQPEQAHPG